MGKGMGAGPPMPYPKWVWTPVGGWYTQHKNWKRNTALMYGAWAVLAVVVFRVSARNERRFSPPDRPIPSQMWCKYANVDDPGCVFGK